jgi:flavin-dependent dehydrogenase
MKERWDVIVVGARCAGATLATLLARGGLQVLVLDAAERGSDMPMSTHFVQPPGMDVLDRLGVGARVRAVTPAGTRYRYALDDVAVICPQSPERASYCVRRSTLDPWLQDAAEEAGAALRFRTRVTELVRSGERVTGVVARSSIGPATFLADLVVGADGRHSSIAQLTGAPEYLVTESSRAGYFGYYSAPETWSYDWDGTTEHLGTDLRYVFRCDGDEVLLTYAGEQALVRAWPNERRLEEFTRAMAGSPTMQPFMEGLSPLRPLIGIANMRFFYRKPIGPGYALTGDAGHFKDFVTGQGISDAFLDAQQLAAAILDGREAAFEHYWRARDVSSLPLHLDANNQGEVGWNEPFLRWVLRDFAVRPELAARITRMIDRQLDPARLVPTRTLVSTLLSAIARGRWDVLRGFVITGKRMASEQRELAQRQRLLEIAQAELAKSPVSARPMGSHQTRGFIGDEPFDASR